MTFGQLRQADVAGQKCRLGCGDIYTHFIEICLEQMLQELERESLLCDGTEMNLQESSVAADVYP